jgi:hypothetical protein
MDLINHGCCSGEKLGAWHQEWEGELLFNYILLFTFKQTKGHFNGFLFFTITILRKTTPDQRPLYFSEFSP